MVIVCGMQRNAFVLRISCMALAVLAAGVAEPVHAQVEAGDVVDRPSLRRFVKAARDEVVEKVGQATEDEVYDFLDVNFRPVGRWHRGSIYMGVILAQEGPDRGTSFFHAVSQEIEGDNLLALVDKNGVRIVEELLDDAGKDFTEYYYDNPDVEGDEKDGSLKVAWGEEIDIAGRNYVIGSGFYPDTAVPVAPPAALLVLAALLAASAAHLRRRQRP